MKQRPEDGPFSHQDRGQPPTPPPSIDLASLEPGTFDIRVLAYLIDVVITLATAAGTGLVCGIVLAVLEGLGRVPPGWGQKVGQGGASGYIVSLLASLLYQTISTGLGGASLGKTICGLRVLAEDGRPCTMGQSFLRSLAFYVDGFFFGLIGKQSMDKSRLQQRYGDHWAHTIVIRARSLPSHARSHPALGILVGLLVYGSLQFMAMMFKAL